MSVKTAVVILNWNGKKLLEQYLPSVVKYSLGCDVIVADNGSGDDSVEFLKQKFPMVKVIPLDRNYGFTGGYNRALAKIEADYYVLLNDDVMVGKGWINPVIKLMAKDKNIAVCQPKILSYIDKNKFEYAGAAGGYIDYLGYPFCAGRVFDTTENDMGQYNDEREIFWASDAAMFVRSDVFRELKGLEESFFAHMEEIDFCWRAKNAGYKVMYCPDSTVYHYGGGTLSKSSPKKTYLNFRNSLLLLYRNLPDRSLQKVLKRRKYLDTLAAWMFFLKGEKDNAKAVFKARKDFMVMKDFFTAGRSSEVKDYPSQVMHKSLVIKTKLQHKTSFMKLKKYIK